MLRVARSARSTHQLYNERKNTKVEEEKEKEVEEEKQKEVDEKEQEDEERGEG